eukprot:scaffold56520_cov31-Tisochrysis_lutea.AAC.1
MTKAPSTTFTRVCRSALQPLARLSPCLSLPHCFPLGAQGQAASDAGADGDLHVLSLSDFKILLQCYKRTRVLLD